MHTKQHWRQGGNDVDQAIINKNKCEGGAAVKLAKGHSTVIIIRSMLQPSPNVHVSMMFTHPAPARARTLPLRAWQRQRHHRDAVGDDAAVRLGCGGSGNGAGDGAGLAERDGRRGCAGDAVGVGADEGGERVGLRVEEGHERACDDRVADAVDGTAVQRLVVGGYPDGDGAVDA